MNTTATIQDKRDKISQYMRKMAPRGEVLSEHLRQLKPNEELLEIIPVAGMPGMKASKVALIMAEEEQALSTTVLESCIYHYRQDPQRQSRT